MLSEFAYAQISEAIERKAAYEGVEVIKVDPAYTSLIGKLKYVRDKGMSVHPVSYTHLDVYKRQHLYPSRTQKLSTLTVTIAGLAPVKITSCQVIDPSLGLFFVLGSLNMKKTRLYLPCFFLYNIRNSLKSE